MPEVSYRRPVDASPDAIWDFVKDINKWAPMMMGYVKHEVESERRSLWTLKGDVGILSREVNLQVDITDWEGPARVAFTLTGVGEAVRGGGAFEILGRDAEAQSMESPGEEPGKQPTSLWSKFLGWVVQFVFRKSLVASPRILEGRAVSASELVFTWSIEAEGATAPLVNAMLAPAMEPAAAHLASEIARAVEA